jgi:hypothetical protein
MSYQEDLENAINLVASEMAQQSESDVTLNEDSVEDRVKFQQAMELVQGAISSGAISRDEISNRLGQD